MPANGSPIYSRLADIQGAGPITAAAADYTGTGTNNVGVFHADDTNGGFVQRMRFKAIGTNAATVARIYVNDNDLGASGVSFYSSILSTATNLTGTPSATGGSLYTGTFYAVVQTIDQWGGVTGFSSEASAAVSSSGLGSISWTWNNVSGAKQYRLFTGPLPNGQVVFFTTSTNSYVQTDATVGGEISGPIEYRSNNYFIGEISLPATASSSTGATVEIDYPLNFALPPGYRLVVGLGTAVAAGWNVTVFGGKY